MKLLTHALPPPYPAPPAEPDAESDAPPTSAGFRRWLKCFALYLSAVIAAGLIGWFFFWQLPLPNDLTSLIDEPSGPPRYRSTPASLIPVTAATPDVSEETDGAAEQLPDLTETATAALSAAESADDPNAPALDGPTETTDDPTAEVSSEEPLPPSPREEIAQLLIEARQQMDNRRITAPAGGNALLTYQRVLELHPGHPEAIAGVQRIAAYYWDVAEQRFRQGQFDEGLSYINRGLRAEPNNRALLSLRQEIRATQQRQQEERALRLEMERQWADEQARLERIRRERQAQQQQEPWWRQAPQHSVNQGFNQR